MLQINPGFISGGNGVLNRGRSSTQSFNLRKDEPHPVALFVSGSEFRKNVIDDRSLGDHKPFEVVGIAGRTLLGSGKHGNRLGNEFTAIPVFQQLLLRADD